MRNSRLIGFAAALALLFASCDKAKELPDDESQDGFAAVRIRSLSVAESGSESLGRSFFQREPEMVTTPVGDGMLLEMSIKQADSPLRDKVKTLLGEGKKFRVIAVNQEDGTYHSHGDFTVGESGPSNDFHVRIGKKYDYICISYNSETDLPPNDYEDGEVPDEVDIDNSNDILWCKINDNQAVPASPAVVELDILLAQKLAKVSVKLDCDYNKWKIGVGSDKVSIRDVATSGTLDLSSGDITSDTPALQTFASFTSVVGATSQTSNELTIMPKANGTITITVSAAAVSREDLSNIPTANRSTTLTTPLDAGSNYVITVQLRIPIFARSNIYWDDGTSYDPVKPPKLTFVPADGTIDNQGYQGVFFKWGSLIGLSPARTGTATAFSTSTPVYIPTYNKTTYANSSWEMKTSHSYTANTSTGWPQISSSAEDGPANIPYLDGRTAYNASDNTGRSSTFVIDAARNTDEMYENRRGDICQYLSKTGAVTGSYRLPTSDEFGPQTTTSWNALTANADGWIKGSFYDNNAAGYADGTADLLTAGKNGSNNAVHGSATNVPMGAVFPAPGYRGDTGGTLGGVGGGAYYWSGSAYSSTRGYLLYFIDGSVNPINHALRSFGFSVRCVKKVDPTGNY